MKLHKGMRFKDSFHGDIIVIFDWNDATQEWLVGFEGREKPKIYFAKSFIIDDIERGLLIPLDNGLKIIKKRHNL